MTRLTTICNREPEKFISCRVGLELKYYDEDLGQILHDYQIHGTNSLSPVRSSKTENDYGQQSNGKRRQIEPNNSWGNFILIPISPPRLNYFDLNNNSVTLTDILLPDLAIDKLRWNSEVAVSIGLLPYHMSDPEKVMQRFDRLLGHALYLPTNVIVIDFPGTSSIHPTIAEIVNRRLKHNHTKRLILFRVSLSLDQMRQRVPTAHGSPGGPHRRHFFKDWPFRDDESETKNMDDSNSESGYAVSSSQSSQGSVAIDEQVLCGWAAWNSIRTHLIPDHRIGVCLHIDEDLEHDFDESEKWSGEPVRMVILDLDRFISSQGFQNTMRPSGGIKEFIKTIAVSNSLLTSFVVQGRQDCDVQEHLECLSKICDTLATEYPDYMRAWDDAPLDPLQPLSNNLDSTTYSVFEEDKMKYQMYGDAMVEALRTLLARPSSTKRETFVIMVLGAGRGPLVDAMIRSINKVNHRGKFFKIYALDKNFSSVVSIKWKQMHYWREFEPCIVTEVIEADMREWSPGEKADIIATELLGSFSDNELSPECIDGTWRFATSQTLCIPQAYSSHLAPICSYRMRQELYKSSLFNSSTCYDLIQVVKLKNYYIISQPQMLFAFQHTHLGQSPVEGANKREETLVFYPKVDTVCHGFAGYFTSKLFGSVKISTVPRMKTPTMDSWFPVFIPIEKPVQLSKNSRLEIKFSRMDTAERVWYEWQILAPEESRIHNLNGVGGSMSKVI